MALRTGDVVYLSTRDGGETIRAVVGVTTDNGRSLVLHFEALVAFPGGCYRGRMPVHCRDDGRWIELVGCHEVRLERAQ